jgi:hypothetical protein
MDTALDVMLEAMRPDNPLSTRLKAAIAFVSEGRTALMDVDAFPKVRELLHRIKEQQNTNGVTHR